MAHTFLCTIETEGINTALKFVSRSKTTSEFMVTFLTAPHIEPFVMMKVGENWKLPCHLPEEVKALEDELLRVANKFQR